MLWTLEEQISAEFDTLWQAAVFLTGGRESEAEQLVLETVVAACDDHSGAFEGLSGSDRLERFMLRRFFEQPLHQGPIPLVVSGTPRILEGDIDVEALLQGAGSVPATSRAALWLVVVRRRSYEDGAGILGIDRDQLRELLQYRDVLMVHAVRRSADAVATTLGQGRAGGERGA